MSIPLALHPSAELLAAFSLGRLNPADAKCVGEHILGCATCSAALNDLPADGLVVALRIAVGHGDEPDATRGLTCADIQPADDLPDIPTDLMGHPRYRVLRVLGRGGMGAVYFAEHTLMERPVALKVIDPRLLSRPGAHERFRQEVRAAARLSHPNIVAAFDADQAGSLTFLVMEYVEGQSLAEVLRSRGPLTVAEACAYVSQAALGLQQAHERGMVHRDIKPHNLMLTPGGQVKVLDFGLARLADVTLARCAHAAGPAASRGLTEAGALMGTVGYIAPEQALDPRTSDGRSDIYSLGCTFFELLTGRVPFSDGDIADKPTRLAAGLSAAVITLRRDVPPGVAAIAERMLAKCPDDRYRTAADVAAALAPYITGRRGLRSRRRKVRTVALGLAVAALCVCLAVVWWCSSLGDRQRRGDESQAVGVTDPPPKPTARGVAEVMGELRRRPPLVDDDFSDRAKSAFAGAFTHDAYHWEPGIFAIKYGPHVAGPGWATWYPNVLQAAPSACRLVGRIPEGTSDRWAVSLGLDPRESPIVVELSSTGVLTVQSASSYPEGSRDGFPKVFRCPQFNAAGEWNTLLVVLTGDHLVVELNDVPVCPPIALAPELPRATLGIAFYTDDRAKSPGVEFKRFTSWDLGPRQLASPGDVTDFRETHGVDRKHFLAWSETLPAWYRLVTVSACAGADEPLFNAVAVRDQRRLASVQYFQETTTDMPRFNTMSASDYRLHTSCLYHSPAQSGELYAWVKDGLGWEGWGGTAVEIANRIAKGKAGGMRPASLSGVHRPNGLFYTTCLEPTREEAWDYRLALSADDLPAWLADGRAEGLRPDLLSAYHDGKQVRFMAIVVKDRATEDWNFAMDLSPAAYELALNENRQRGRHPRSVMSYVKEHEVRYAAVWLPYQYGGSNEEHPHP